MASIDDRKVVTFKGRKHTAPIGNGSTNEAVESDDAASRRSSIKWKVIQANKGRLGSGQVAKSAL